MAFQFLCPQGHLLEGPESLIGQSCQCPHCASVFVVPAPARAVQAAPFAGSPEENLGLFDHGPTAEDNMFEQMAGAPAPAPAGNANMFDEPPPAQPVSEAEAAAAADAVSGKEDPNRICRLICPCQRALELPTPKSMMGSDALCPYCGVQFQLRYEDTLEFKEEREHARELRDQIAGKRWLKWAYIMAGVIGICLIGMLIFDALNKK